MFRKLRGQVIRGFRGYPGGATQKMRGCLRDFLYFCLTMKKGLILRYLRVAVQVVVAAALTVWIASVSAAWFPEVGEWLQRLQFGPAVLGLSLTIVVLWLIVTSLFGRIYCSTVCPLGALQDVASRCRPKSRVYRWMRPLNSLRYGVLFVVAAAFALSITLPLLILDPFAVYANLVNVLAKVGPISLAGIVASIALIAVVSLMAWKSGRLWCDTFCPVGAALSLVSRHSVYRIDIDTDRCTNCRRCEYACKSRCINLDDHVADMSRCVVCFRCLSVCKDGAICYAPNKKRLSTPLMEKIDRAIPKAGPVSTANSECNKPIETPNKPL